MESARLLTTDSDERDHPFTAYDDALRDWRNRAEENRGEACLRFSIAAEGVTAQASLHAR